ncbi:MAG: DUF2939 domain-containing protein [Syntrophus sp. (in: bacteria)]|nr:DUF2939 domain-containing protein [Syntrophus sp. (in: bacteria)]
MKKIAGWILLIVLAAGLYAAAAPYLTLYMIQSGVEQSDPEKISKYVDFPALRANLKTQVHSHIQSGETPSSRENPIATAANRLVSKMADDAVDSLVTPAVLKMLAQGEQRRERSTRDSSPGAEESKGGFLKNASCRYESLDTFSVTKKDDKNREIRLILSRSGLSWKLSNIILPRSE